MKTNKIQKDIFNALCGESFKCASVKISETETAFTFDGNRAYVLPNKIIGFNPNKMVDSPGLKKVFDKDNNDKLMDISNDLRLANGGRKMLRKLTCQEGEYLKSGSDKEATEMWVDNKFLDYFENPHLYANSTISRILVYEPRVSKDICAVILPTRV